MMAFPSVVLYTLVRRSSGFALYTIVLLAFALEPLKKVLELSLDLANSHLSYISLIPFISAALLYANRKRIFQKVDRAVIPAAAAGGLAVLLSWAAWSYKS